MMPSPSKSFLPDDLPIELEALYHTSEVNEPVCLYDGELEFAEENRSFRGNGQIILEWLPVPKIMFRAEFLKWPPGHLPNGSLKTTCGRSVKASVTHFRNNAVSGKVKTSEFGCGDSLASVLLHIPNFPSFVGKPVRDGQSGRAVIEADNWRVTIDQIKNGTNQGHEDLEKRLKDPGGFGITHIAKVERSDGRSFSSGDLAKLKTALKFFLSFCRGSWVAPVLPFGFDHHGTQVWEEWYVGKVEHWRRVISWFNASSSDGLVATFPGFIDRRNGETWREPVELATHWYVESNMCAGGVEGSIILAQAAFELLAWTLLVKDRKTLSKTGFQKLAASDKLRLLFTVCRLPLSLPPSLKELDKVAREFNWVDGPQAITEVRNALVHPNPKQREIIFQRDSCLTIESWLLSLWYLEMVFLWLYGFQGKYSNRLVQNQRKGDEVQLVPWAQAH